jgi:hypothetical protein
MSVLSFATAAMSDDALAKAKPDDYARLLPLLAALGDAKATAAAAKKLAEKATEADGKMAAADERMVQADRKDAIVQARIDSADELIAQRRAECDKRIAAKEADADARFAAREKKLVQGEQAVEEARERNIKLHDDLERRLMLVKQAST